MYIIIHVWNYDRSVSETENVLNYEESYSLRFLLI